MKQRPSGFTLLEVLIALFIFSILSVLLASALRTVINAQEGSEKHAERLRQVQMALLMLSRDVEQTVNRRIVNSTGREEMAFVGGPNGFIFTRAGFANPMGTVLRSTLQRSRYYWSENTLWRTNWEALDQAPETQSSNRRLLSDVVLVHFQYLDKDKRFHDIWPLEGDTEQVLPRAVKIEMTISSWGKMSQLYVIPVQASKVQSPPTPAPKN